MLRRLPALAGTLCLTLAAGALALELYLRMFLKQSLPRDARTAGLLVPSNVPGLGYRLAANFPGPWAPTDSLGIRWRPPDPVPPRHKILLIGDSVIFAGGVGFDSALGAMLERRLSAEPGIGPVAVLNSGVPVYNTAQEEVLLQDLAPRVHPDLIVVAYCMNDHAEPLALRGGQLMVPAAFERPSAHPGFSIGGLLAGSRALYYLRQRLRDLQLLYPEAFPGRLHYVRYLPNRPGWGASKQALLRIREVARQSGARLLVAIFPVEPQLRLADHTAQDDLLKFGRAHEISMLDLYPTLQPHWREHLFFDYSVEVHAMDKLHLSPRGHELAAGAIAGALLAEPRRFLQPLR